MQSCKYRLKLNITYIHTIENLLRKCSFNQKSFLTFSERNEKNEEHQLNYSVVAAPE